MTLKTLLLILFLAPIAVHAQISVRTVKMELDGKNYLQDVYSKSKDNSKKPGVLLIPEFWGKDDLYKPQAEWLVAQGYVVMVMDLYGDGNHSTQSSFAEKLQREAETQTKKAPKITDLLALISKSIDELKKQPGVDPKKIAAIGFGYGGGLITNLAKQGDTPGLKAVVSYYGGVKKILPAHKTADSPPLLYIRADYDSYTLKDSFNAFVDEMKKEKLDLEVLELKDAHYGFVHRQIGSYGSDDHLLMYYNAPAAALARARVETFLKAKLSK
jgi:dienelactone hydrolase